jgi:hypothetical protein
MTEVNDVNDAVVTLEFGEGETKERLDVKIGELDQVVGRLMTINQATLSYTRNLKTGEYKSESPFCSLQVNLQDAWAAIPKISLADPKTGVAIWQKMMAATNNKLGNTARYVYRIVLAECLARATTLRLTEASILADELKRFGEPGAFDPLGVLNRPKET